VLTHAVNHVRLHQESAHTLGNVGSVSIVRSRRCMLEIIKRGIVLNDISLLIKD